MNGVREIIGSLRLAVALLIFSVLAPAVAAQEVFRTVDENGVVTFSDMETEDSERLELPPTIVRENAMAEQRAMIEQQLEVANALEASRLAREAARTERLEALAESEPRTIYYREEDRYVNSGWGYWSGGSWGGSYWPGRPPGQRPPLKPVHPIEPPPEVSPPPSRRVPLPPLKPD